MAEKHPVYETMILKSLKLKEGSAFFKFNRRQDHSSTHSYNQFLVMLHKPSTKEKHMSEETTPTEKGPVKRTRGKKKKITFLFKNKENKLDLIKHETEAFTLSDAWEECSKDNEFTTETKVHAFLGDVEWAKEKLRKPTYQELLAKEGFSS